MGRELIRGDGISQGPSLETSNIHLAIGTPLPLSLWGSMATRFIIVGLAVYSGGPAPISYRELVDCSYRDERGPPLETPPSPFVSPSSFASATVGRYSNLACLGAKESPVMSICSGPSARQPDQQAAMGRFAPLETKR